MCPQPRPVSLRSNLIFLSKSSSQKESCLKRLSESASLISSDLIRHQQLLFFTFLPLCCCSHSRKICFSLCPDLVHLFLSSFCSRGCELSSHVPIQSSGGELINAISFHRSGIHPCCEKLPCIVSLEIKTSLAQQ